MALKEGWKVSDSARDSLSRELTYLADYCGSAEGLSRPDAEMMHNRLMAIANTIANIETVEGKTEESHDTPPKRKRTRSRAEGRAVAPDHGDFSRVLHEYGHYHENVPPSPLTIPQRFRERDWYTPRSNIETVEFPWSPGGILRRSEDEGGE